MQLIAEWFKQLYAVTGMNFSVFYDGYDWHRYLNALWVTIYLSLASMIASLIVGACGAWLEGSPFLVLRNLVRGFVLLFRNTPPLVQLFFFYFGLGTLLPARVDELGMRAPLLSNVQWAIISLSLFAGAFNVEIFRSGIEAVPRATIEASEALGYSRTKAYIYIVLPLAIRVCLPALNNNLVNLIKTTTLAYAVAVPEVLYTMKEIWSDSQNVPEMMVVLFATYMALVGILVRLMNRWERVLAIPGYGN